MNKELIHDTLNKIYEEANSIYIQVKKAYPSSSINSYNGHFLRINNEYVYQHYYMPVISNEERGDICFNLDGISFEFFLKTEEFRKIALNELLKLPYSIEMYDGENSEEDIYYQDMDIEELYNQISKLEKIGITINCQTLPHEEIVSLFTKVSNIIYPN